MAIRNMGFLYHRDPMFRYHVREDSLSGSGNVFPSGSKPTKLSPPNIPRPAPPSAR